MFAVFPSSLLLPKVAASGIVRDDVSGDPIAGVRVSSGTLAATTPADGTFGLARVGLAEVLLIETDGYLPTRVGVFPPRQLRVALAPRTFGLTVRDAETGEPISDASVTTPARASAAVRAQAISSGRFHIGPARRQMALTVEADGYTDASLA